MRGIPCPNGKGIVRAEVVEARIEQIVTSLRLPPSWKALIVEYLRASQGREQAANERARLRERLRRLQQLYLDGYSEEEYRREKEAILAALETVAATPEREVLALGDHV